MAQRTPVVLFGVDSLRAGNGGICRVARLMARVLEEMRDEGRVKVRTVVLGDNEPPTDLSLPVQACGRSRAWFALKALRQAMGCSHCLYDSASIAQIQRLPLLRRRPSLMFLHGIEIWEDTLPKYVAAARRMTALVSNSSYTRARAQRSHGGFDRASICWLATESDVPGAGWEEGPPRAPEVLIVSRIDEKYKGHRQLIACWPQVVARVPEAALNIVGSGPDLAALKAEAARSPVAEKIRFHGFVAEPELEQMYARARVFAMPSRGEGFGLVYIEAMRHGLPVVAAVHDAASEIVLDGQTGYAVDLDRPDELPGRLIELLTEPEKARQLGEAGQRRWAAHFRYQSFRERFRPILEDFFSGVARESLLVR